MDSAMLIAIMEKMDLMMEIAALTSSRISTAMQLRVDVFAMKMAWCIQLNPSHFWVGVEVDFHLCYHQ